MDWLEVVPECMRFYGGGPTEWLEGAGADRISALYNYIPILRARASLLLYQALAVTGGHMDRRKAESQLRRWERDTRTSDEPDSASLPNTEQRRAMRRVRAAMLGFGGG